MRGIQYIFALSPLLVVGCGVINGDPPARVIEKAEETIPRPTYSVSTAANSTPRIETLRPQVVAVSEPLPSREDWPLAKTAADSLARIGAPAVPQVVALLADADPLTRVRGANILSQIGPDAAAAVPTLTGCLNDPDPRVQKAAAQALGQIGPAASAAVPALLRAAQEQQP